MIIKNPWIGYLTRGYSQIRDSIKNRLLTYTPEITDHSESNILIIIVSIFSGLVEQLNYYIDNMMRESYISTVRRLANIIKLVKLIGYKIRPSISASVELSFTSVDSEGDPIELVPGESLTIPLGTKCSTLNGVQYVTIEEGVIESGESNILVKARQRVWVTGQVLGTSDGNPNQSFLLPANFEHETDVITIDGTVWIRKSYLDLSLPTDQHYMVDVAGDGTISVIFGDGVNGAIPTSSLDIVADYATTSGNLGRVDSQAINQLIDSITIPVQDPPISEVIVNNILPSVGGLGREGLEDIRRNAILSLRTLDRAVTRQDFIDITKLSPGVGKAAISFDCSRDIWLYIAPVGGGIADQTLIDSTESYVNERKIIGREITIYPAGETYIGLVLDVKARFRVDGNLCKADIENALVEAYSSENSDINKPIRTSDIVALIDNLSKVDYLELTAIYSIPYARPISSGAPELDWYRKTLSSSTTEQNWKIIFRYNGGTGEYFDFYKNGLFIQQLLATDPTTDLGGMNILEARILSLTGLGVAQDGCYWEFKTYPYNENLELDDFTVPTINLDYVELVVSEQLYTEN